jgi:hypothetical protein
MQIDSFQTFPPKWIISDDRVQVDKKLLGKGCYGAVYQGILDRSVDVAVKKVLPFRNEGMKRTTYPMYTTTDVDT